MPTRAKPISPKIRTPGPLNSRPPISISSPPSPASRTNVLKVFLTGATVATDSGKRLSGACGSEATMGPVSDAPEPQVDPRVLARYEVYDEDARLWRPGLGDLVRLRTWDILDRFLPAGGRVLDVGGGPGTHAAYLAARGDDVTLIEPVARHVAQARARARDGSAPFAVWHGDAGHLPVPSASVDAVVLIDRKSVGEGQRLRCGRQRGSM